MDPMMLETLLTAIEQQHWPIVAAVVITFVVYAANRYGLREKVGEKWVPWVAVGLGLLSAIGAQLSTGMEWHEALGSGFLAGATATGMWELLLKRVLPGAVKTESSVPPSDSAL